MEPTIKAIIARFGGDSDKAREYCTDMMKTYPKLFEEYREYRAMIN